MKGWTVVVGLSGRPTRVAKAGHTFVRGDCPIPHYKTRVAAQAWLAGFNAGRK